MSEEYRDRSKLKYDEGASSRPFNHEDFESPMKGEPNSKTKYDVLSGRETSFSHEDFESPRKGKDHEKEDEVRSISSFGTPEKGYYSEKMPLLTAKTLPPPGRIVFQNFLGRAPNWYKVVVIIFLICNPCCMAIFGKFFTGWLITAEFIFTLVMSLHCYALQPGGLIILEAVMMGMVSSHMIYHQVLENIPVIFLVIFMVAGIHFMRDFLMHFFTKLIVKIPNKIALSLVFMMTTALFSAWLDALTVTAVIMNACYGFYAIYHRIAAEETRLARTSPRGSPPVAEVHNVSDGHSVAEHGMVTLDDSQLSQNHRETLADFRLFLRSLLMHAVVGTAVGGALTEVGEPQNLLIAEKVGWTFSEYFWRSCTVSLPTCLAAFILCFLLERFERVGKVFGHGYKMPEDVRQVLTDYAAAKANEENYGVKVMLIVQVVVALMLVVFLGTHVAAVGLIGLTVIVLLTSFNGIVDEAQLGHAFTEAMPFTALLVIFFAVAGIIEENELFRGLVDSVLELSGHGRIMGLFIIDGVLSSVSDNVFVATLYINELARSFSEGMITKAELNLLAVTINISTNIPSIATPNGQAAFLFLYTSKLAPLCDLSYFRMMLMTLPYTIGLTAISFLMIFYLHESTQMLVDAGLLDSL